MKQYSFLTEGAGLTAACLELGELNPMITKALGNNVYKQYCRCKQRIEIICGDAKGGDLYLSNVHIYGTSDKKDQLMKLFSNLKDILGNVGSGEQSRPPSYSWTDVDTGKTEHFDSDDNKLNIPE